MWWPSGVIYLSVVWFRNRESIQTPAHTSKIFTIWKLIDDWSLIYTNERIIIIFIRNFTPFLFYFSFSMNRTRWTTCILTTNKPVKSAISYKSARFLSIVCIECQIYQLTCCSDVTSSLLLSSVTEIGWLERSLSLGRWPVSTSRPWKFAAIEMHWSAFRLHLSVLSQYTGH